MKFLNIRTIGIVLLLWFLISIVVYVISGQFETDIRSLPAAYNESGAFGFSYCTLRICSTLLMLVVIPLALKGKIFALYGGVTYLAVGFNLNPFQYLLPKRFLIPYAGRYILPVLYSRIWSISSLIVFVAFFIYMKKRSLNP